MDDDEDGMFATKGEEALLRLAADLRAQLAAAIAAKKKAERERAEDKTSYALLVDDYKQLGLDVDHLRADRDRLAGEVAALQEALEDNCWDLRCVDEPTGGDDADVAWIVIEHHMAKPHEREVGRGKTPLDALRAALSQPAQGAQGEASAGEKGGEA